MQQRMFIEHAAALVALAGRCVASLHRQAPITDPIDLFVVGCSRAEIDVDVNSIEVLEGPPRSFFFPPPLRPARRLRPRTR